MHIAVTLSSQEHFTRINVYVMNDLNIFSTILLK
jgi:hypothetical protein